MPDQSIGALTGGELTWSDDRSWHFSAVPTAPSDVRFQGVSSIGQCNTSCSLLAGVSKAKVFRGR